MKTLIKALSFSCITLILCMTNAWSVDIENGKALHDANCMRCHQESIYTRKDRLIYSYPELRERISQCELGAELTWFDEEIDDVTAYLNDAFYHFEIAN